MKSRQGFRLLNASESQILRELALPKGCEEGFDFHKIAQRIYRGQLSNSAA
jgi:hypothetical protein